MIYELVFSATKRTENVLDIFSAQWGEEKMRIEKRSMTKISRNT